MTVTFTLQGKEHFISGQWGRENHSSAQTLIGELVYFAPKQNIIIDTDHQFEEQSFKIQDSRFKIQDNFINPEGN